jgi:uridine phosphorylase
MAATRPDLKRICGLVGLGSGRQHPLYISELVVSGETAGGVAVAGPVVGASYAAMILETLICWGAREIFFCGWCGAISSRASIGDLIVPQRAFIDEGTSRHYGRDGQEREAEEAVPPFSSPSAVPFRQLAQAVGKEGHQALTGPVWSTDAIYRETPQQVRRYRELGCLAVEMELSALFSVAAFRQAALAGVLVVSDDLSALSWKPGFRQPVFREGRHAACRAVADLAVQRLDSLEGE